MPTVKEYWEAYYEKSGQASELARTLSLSAIAVVWLFKLETPDGIKLPVELIWPLGLAVLALTLDFLQYAYLAAAWRIRARCLEKSAADPDLDHTHSPWLPRVGELFFAGKLVAVGATYIMLMSYLVKRLM